MHETYRMLGREHEADLEREAANAQRAAQVQGGRRNAADVTDDRPQKAYLARTRVVAFLARAARGAG